MMNLYGICAITWRDILQYCKENAVLTACLIGAVMLALMAIVLLLFQKHKLKLDKKKAEEAVIFLETLEKEQQARDKEEAQQKAKEEEARILKEEKAKRQKERENDSVSPKKICLFCGKENSAHADFCEECAGKKFGTQEEYETRKSKRVKERAEKQARKKLAEEVGITTIEGVPSSGVTEETPSDSIPASAAAPIEPLEESTVNDSQNVAEKKTDGGKKGNFVPMNSEKSKRQETMTIDPKQPKYAGKWLLYHLFTKDENEEDAYFFELRASNGEKLFASEEYTTYSGAINGIATHKKNIESGNFRIVLSKKGHYMFKLLTGKNTLLCTGENYPTRARCENAIESVKRFAVTALLDEDLQELLITPPAEDSAPVPEIAENCNGKWIISSKQNVDNERVFYFDLYANNGEKLLSSEEYTSYIGAINGITTHKKNIQSDNFRISLTKRGDYVVKLLNGNGQLLCLGEHYRTKRLCQRAVESVKRFALSSPVLTDEKTAKL